jgi:hypothetical protein
MKIEYIGRVSRVDRDSKGKCATTIDFTDPRYEHVPQDVTVLGDFLHAKKILVTVEIDEQTEENDVSR